MRDLEAGWWQDRRYDAELWLEPFCTGTEMKFGRASLLAFVSSLQRLIGTFQIISCMIAGTALFAVLPILVQSVIVVHSSVQFAREKIISGRCSVVEPIKFTHVL